MRQPIWKRLKPGLLLIAFGICLFCLLQNLGVISSVIGYVLGAFYPILLGLCLAFVLNILMRAIEELLGHAKRLASRPKLRRGLCLLITLVIVLAVLAALLLVLIPKLVEAVEILVQGLPQSSQEFSEWLTGFLIHLGVAPEKVADIQRSILSFANQSVEALKQSSIGIANSVWDILVAIFGSFKDILFAIIIAMYVLMDKERIGQFLNRLMARVLPGRRRERALQISGLSCHVFSAYFKGQVLEAVILGTLCFVVTALFRIPHAAVVSLLVGVTALIPVLGAWIGGGISAFLVAMSDPMRALLLILLIVVLQIVEGNLIYPKVVGTTIGLPGILVLGAAIIGQGLAGIAGLLLSVPLAGICYALVKGWLDEPGEN